ncbi:hypothetical protein [Glaciimonas sp. PCH181]|uniref:hypothetical protein n=1 Tax=Glaciimonas sp. PCH181 TaxID=2133943 RepID=UPI000D373AFA|nr:hypothetical protein [Glaciimonas sp. PCH181]PUA20197.1 hypothetical protein C7W93_10590 [Glaciimonas sp. PCH181]
MIDKKNTLLSVAVALALAACGGGGGSTSTPTPTAASTTSGKAVDGYLSGSAVLCDTNKNGVADTGEAVVLTDAQGNFTFTTACASNIVVSGGTNIDTGLPFTGVLKTTAGSTVATPITSLMVDAGLTNAQVAAFLGLPVGTDPTKLDPSATTNGVLNNPDALKRTLALQQIIQQTTNTIATLGGNTTVAALQAIYLNVVKAVTAALVANPTASLIDASGNVSSGLVNNVVQQSVTNVATSSDPTLVNVKTIVATFSPSRIAAVATAAITAEAQTLATTTNSLTLTKAMQSDNTIANAVNAVGPLMLPTNTQPLTTFASALSGLASANTTIYVSPQAALAAETAAANSLNSAASAVGQTVDATKFSAPTNYLAITNDQIAINGTTYTLTQLTSGVIVTSAKVASVDTFALPLSINGTPIPANANGIKTATIKVALELKDTAATNRLLQVAIDTVTVTLNANGQLSASVPASAKIYVFGQTSSGVTANLTLSNPAATLVTAGANNTISFNMGGLFSQIASTTQNAVLTDLQNLKGNLNVKFVMSTLDLRTSNGTPTPAASILVTGAGQPAVSGEGVQGIVTVQ